MPNEQTAVTVRTRFAPSPTGFMHVGSIRTALYAWLYARQHGGAFVLRIEDTDKEREVEGSIEHIMQSLTWLGLSWDEGPTVGGPYGPYIQSERLDTYRTYAKRLIEAGHAYADPYTEEEVAALRASAEARREPFLYRNHRPSTTKPWDGSTPLRFRVPRITRYEWQDAVRGTLSAGEEALDDFILIKSDGYPTYNFAHVVDDIEMRITHVMRGDEFISSTPKFLSLYEALGVTPPVFASLPVILGPDGKKKLSKRDGSKDILDYRTDGYVPEAMVNFLALLGWHPAGDQEVFTSRELIDAFQLERIQHAGARFDEQKLLFLNREHMRTLSDDEYLALGELTAPNPERLRKALPLLRERAQTFSEARSMLADGELRCLFNRPRLDHATLVAKERASGETITHLRSVESSIQALPEEPSVDDIKTALMPYADAQEAAAKGGRGAVLWPLRYALSGLERSADPFMLTHILGRNEALFRVAAAIAILAE